MYEAANKTKSSLAVVICHTAVDQAKAKGVVQKLGLDKPDARPLAVIDVRSANKPSASKA